MKKLLIHILLTFMLLAGGALPAGATLDYNIKNDTESFLFVSGTSGNVGIGTTVPVGQFEVRGGAAAPARVVNINGTFADLGGSRTGLYTDVTASVAGTYGVSGSWSQVRTSADTDTYTSAISGAYAEATHEGDATVTDLMGLLTLANQTGTGPVTHAYGIVPQVWKGSGTVANAYGMYFQGVPTENGDTHLDNGIVQNQYGLGILHLTTATLRNIAILLDDDAQGAAVTGAYGILQEDTAPNSFAGNIGVGTTEVNAQLVLHSTGPALVDAHWNEDTTGAAANESQYKAGKAGENRTGAVQKFRFYNGYGSFQEVGQIAVTAPGVTGGVVGGAIDIYTQGEDAPGLVRRMTIDEHKAMFANNVGLGTSEPAARLHIAVDNTQPDAMEITGSDAYIKGNLEVDGKIYGDGSLLSNLPGGTEADTLDSVTARGATTVNAVGIGTTTVTGNLTTTGNVGVGSTVPGSLLDVAGTVQLRGAAGGTGLYVNATGCVGIGGISPGYALDVTGTVKGSTGLIAGSSYTLSGTQASGLFVGGITRGNLYAGTQTAGGANPWIFASGSGTYTGGYHAFNVDGAEVMRVVNGNVGIGTTAPLANLQVGRGTNTVAGSPTLGANDALITGNLVVDGKIYGDGSALSGITGGMTWTEVTGTSATMAGDGGYIANNAGLVTLTLPATAAVGTTVAVVGSGAGGWKIAQNSDDIIHFGNQDTTTSTTGYLSSTNRYDVVELICIVANDEWVVRSSVGNITVF